jgi:hypothetical protein
MLECAQKVRGNARAFLLLIVIFLEPYVNEKDICWQLAIPRY